MAKNSSQFIIDKFSTGLNIVDSPHDMENSDLQIAQNVTYLLSGEAESIDGLLQVGGTITVNSSTATKILGGVKFNGNIYLLASNDSEARMVYLNSGTWTEVSSVNFDPDALADFEIYNDNIWFVNGLTTNSNVLHFINTSNTLSGLTVSSGLEEGINRIVLHLERIWISKNNKIFVSIQFPTAADGDWDATRDYAGSNAPGLIQLDNNTEDQIGRMVSHFGQLTVFREFTIFVVTGVTILTSTIVKSFNSRGVISDFSIGKSDLSIYFLSREGVKQFKGITTQDQTTQFDSISSISIDRKIKPEITTFPDITLARGYAFKDKYYLSDGNTVTLVFDEITGGWSKWTVGGAEVFIEDGDNLFCAKGSKYYQINANASGSVTSHIRTKDFNLETDQFYKLFEKLLATFKTFTSSESVILEWYINGVEGTSGTKDVTLIGAGIEWDAGITWDSGLNWDSGSIKFVSEKKRNLGYGVTISFGVKATGTSRFSISGFDLLYELMRKEA